MAGIPAAALPAVLLLAPLVGAQDDPRRAADIAERWLASDQDSRELLETTVTQLLAPGNGGLAWLGAELGAAAEARPTPRTKGVRALASQVVLEFLRREHKRPLVHVGQYLPLAPLQPFVGDLLFDLLLDTPEWYPLTFRVRLVPALRDLQQRIPAGGRVERILAIVEDDREPMDLRRALAAMLWQWGEKKPASRFVQDLIADTTEGDAEDRVHATLQLADYYCLLRDYRGAARAHRSAQALAADAGVELRPVAWYAAACVHALLGELEPGMAALERCVGLQTSPHLDKSLLLERELFEQDPEIDLLRKDPRFEALFAKAFPAATGDQDKARGR